MDIKHYFTSPIIFFRNKKLIPDLKEYIYKQESTGINSDVAIHLKKNLIESKFDFFCREDEIINKTKYFIGKSLAKVINEFHSEDCEYKIKFMDSWFHIGKTNSVHEPHIHANCSWCGIYYIETGEEGSGQTSFRNPAYSTYLDYGSRWLDVHMEAQIKPENGLLILFPSYLQHHQSIYTGKKDRIVVAFNAQVWSGDTKQDGVQVKRTKWK
tara:strand:+ start:6294 stop:6929 length:636 start_codon:yes stop_codon:yes gene_type:complete